MKLIFPKGEHDQVLLSPGKVTIGSAAECEIRLTAPGVGLHHAELDVQAGGAELIVSNPD